MTKYNYILYIQLHMFIGGIEQDNMKEKRDMELRAGIRTGS